MKGYRKMTMGIDVDNTILTLMSKWIAWICSENDITKPKDIRDLIIKINTTDTYSIPEYLSRSTKYFMVSQNTQDFWSTADIYDRAVLFDGVIEFFERWSEKIDILLISHCRAGHKDSKLKFLNDLILNKYPIKFIDTKYKQYIDVDILVDDCPQVIEAVKQRRSSVINTIFYAAVLPAIRPIANTADKIVYGWDEIDKYVGNLYKKYDKSGL